MRDAIHWGWAHSYAVGYARACSFKLELRSLILSKRSTLWAARIVLFSCCITCHDSEESTALNLERPQYSVNPLNFEFVDLETRFKFRVDPKIEYTRRPFQSSHLANARSLRNAN